MARGSSRDNRVLNIVCYSPHMRAQNSDDTFYVTYSKWKIWGLACLSWFMAGIMLAGVCFLIWIGGSTTKARYIVPIVILFLAFLLFSGIPFLHLTRVKKPIAVLTRGGVSGMKNFKELNFTWSPEMMTYITRGPHGWYANTILATPDSSQSRMSKLWAGPKSAIIIHNRFAEQKYQEVLEAIDRLSPYSVKRTTHWGSSKH